MQLINCLLDKKNSFPINQSTLGNLILQSGKDSLWEPRKGNVIDCIVIHYISASNVNPLDPFNFESILKIFVDYGVSSHYIIDRTGIVYNLVPELFKAWHCGGSVMPEPDNRTWVNDFSIGIELIATESSGFTLEQYKSLSELSIQIEKRHENVIKFVGHDQIAGEKAIQLGLRKDVKKDPGDLFNWDMLFSLLNEKRKSYNLYT